MPSSPQWSADPQKQAEFMEEFRNVSKAELSAIHNRLTWLLIPTFFILLVVLGLAVITWMKVNELEGKVKGLEKSIDDVSKGIKAKRAEAVPVKLRYADNGLTAAERADFYHLAEGSEVFPLTWLKALEAKNGSLFLQDVERLGFLPDPENADGLPVGLTSGVTIGLEPLGPMVGLNCAACHAGEIHYKDQRFRIDGAPNLLNTREFFKSLIDSAITTAKDPAKLVAFLARVKDMEEKSAGVEPSRIRKFARRLLVRVAEREEEEFNEVLKPLISKIIDKEFASERLDLSEFLKEGVQDEKAFREKIVKDLKVDGIAEAVKKSKLLKELADEVEQNSTLMHALEDAYIAVRLLRARAAFLKKLAPVGDDERTNWGPGRVDAFGSARTFLFQPGYLPIHAVSYPPIFELKTHNWFHYDDNTNTFLERNFGQALGVGAVYDPKTLNSTLQPQNLVKLETLARKLTAPKWPTEILGPIDEDRAKRGAKLYTTYCAECHEAPKDGSPWTRLFDLDEIKTDPGRAQMFAEKLPDGRPFPEAIRATMLELKTKEIANFPPAEKAAIEKQPVDWRGPAKYSARTMKGSWATAPYLHNGSVPTMDDLLKPAKERPAKFYVGSHEYDVVKLGYKSDPKTSLFDTTTAGNSNAGHEGERYGTSMSDDERKDLIEYLKTQ